MGRSLLVHTRGNLRCAQSASIITEDNLRYCIENGPLMAKFANFGVNANGEWVMR